ncbi:MAG: hypothetical protein JWQ09_2091 [Segetibacter sp.]|nr:hypothetical protein [Segetibacter sp.]
MNEVILSKNNLVMKRLWNLDTNAFESQIPWPVTSFRLPVKNHKPGVSRNWKRVTGNRLFNRITKCTRVRRNGSGSKLYSRLPKISFLKWINNVRELFFYSNK